MPESEIFRFIHAWMIVYACLAYTYVAGKIAPPGKVRSLLIMPVVALFLLLPLPLRLTSVPLGGLTGLFISWVGSFKLALFALGKGPLATDIPNITFSQFLAVGSLPIIISKKSSVMEYLSTSTMDRIFVFKAVSFALVYKMFRFESQLHPIVTFLMYGYQIYLTLEFIAFGIRAVAEPLLGLDLDLPFIEPIISTSVQNFWGRRWNLAVGGILRTSVYDPLKTVMSPYVGRRHAQRLGVLATFGTSALMHEIIFYYLSRKQPTWDMTWFFLLHGIVVVVETDMKRLVGKKWQLPWMVSVLLTLSFMSSSSLIVIYPKIQQCNGRNVHAAEEFAPF